MYHLSKLKNGINLITVPVSGTRATTLLAMFPVGSRYETPELSGASHFVEHMLFKGTIKRPTAADLSSTIERYGADYNAFTSKDYTGYYIKIEGSKMEIAADILADMLIHSTMAAHEVEKEKGAIVEELRMYRDNPQSFIDLLSDGLTFGDNQLGWDIGGTEETVRGISRDALWHHFQRHYAPRNMVLVVAGNINQKLLKKSLAYFAEADTPAGATTLNFYKKEFNHFKWPERVALDKRVLVHEKKLDQAQVIINFPALASNDPSRFVLTLLLNILGGGMSSRLFLEVREKRGLAYAISTGSATHRETGVAYVQAGLDPARLSEAIKIIKKELEKVAESGVTAEELANAKTNVAGRMALATEDSSSQAQWYAKYFLFAPTILTHAQALEKIHAVTATQVHRLAQKIFRWNEMRLAVLAPITKSRVMEMLD